MLGDLDGDHRWTSVDLATWDSFVNDPFAVSAAQAELADLNQNGSIDQEDASILRALVAAGGDPYQAEEVARIKGVPFPRPRECYRYVSLQEYHPRPFWALPHDFSPALIWLAELPRSVGQAAYAVALDAAAYSEAVRLDLGWRKREAGLFPVERDYAAMKLARASALAGQGDRYELLLALMELV